MKTRINLLVAALLLASAASALAAVHYVDVNSTNATPPYTNWTTAATNIQDAVDAATAGDEVMVTDGTYAGGGRSWDGSTTNRMVVDKPLNIRSVNGPLLTIIDGGGSVRCVYFANYASLSGFTLTNGFVYGEGGGASGGTLNSCILGGNSAHSTTGTGGDDGVLGNGGGAAYCTLNNCTLTGNSANNDSSWCPLCNYGRDCGDGGGAYYCTLNNCTLTGNWANNYYAFGPLPRDPADDFGRYGDGGGAAYCTLNNCTLTHNAASMQARSLCTGCTLETQGDYGDGGGAYHCTLKNCTLTDNTASTYFDIHGTDSGNYGDGGGAAYSTLYNCTLAGNSCYQWASYWYSYYGIYANGGGAYACTLNNCIVYFNTVFGPLSSAPDVLLGDAVFGTTMSYCCTPDPWGGHGNITNAPLFVDTNGWANLRLQSNSPCINAGNNAFAPAGPDLDGNPRIAGGTVDIGAYEFQAPVSQISYAWLQDYGLLINAATDTADPDGDGVDNYHEWLASTNPTNSLSSPAQLTITASGVPPSVIILTWPTNAVGFTLQSTTNVDSSAVWSTNSPAPVVIGSQNVVTNPFTGSQRFYRLVR